MAALVRSLAVLLCLAASAAAAPERVVSMNLCTDQLALLLASPGQLASVSDWAVRPSASNMVAQARAVGTNSGAAEEVFLLKPDLVLAGAFSDRVTVAMLRRLGLRVEIFAPARSVAEMRDALRRMGRLLGREPQAEAVLARFDARLEALAERAAGLPREGAAYHYPNNFTAGSGTLAAEVLDRAGLANAAAEAGIEGVARLDLESLVMMRPFLVRSAHISGAEHGRAFESARHPALAAIAETGRGARLLERWQVCGTPFLAEAIGTLVAARTAPR